MSTPAGWQTDPTGRFELRYWDGTRWSDHVANGGQPTTNRYDASSGGEPTALLSVPAPTEVRPAPVAPPAPPHPTLARVRSHPAAAWAGVGVIVLVVIVTAVVLLFVGGGTGRSVRPPTSVVPSLPIDPPFSGVAEGLTEEMRQQLAEVYASSLGIPMEQAECLAAKSSDLVEAGGAGPGDVLDFFSECGISLDGLGQR